MFILCLKIISQTIPYEHKNIIHDTFNQRMNILDHKNWPKILSSIKDNGAELVFVDPIYPGLGNIDAEKVNLFTQLLTVIQNECKTSHLITHHSSRSTVTKEGDEKNRRSPYYGSMIIMAHVTGSYHVEQNADGLVMHADKSSQSNLMDKIITTYDPATHISALDVPSLPADNRFLTLSAQWKTSKKHLKFKEIALYLQVSDSTLRSILRTHQNDGIYKVFKILNSKEFEYHF